MKFGGRLNRLAVLLAYLTVSFSACDAEDRFFDSLGARLRYRIEGKGEPVVVLHGLLGRIEQGSLPTALATGK